MKMSIYWGLMMLALAVAGNTGASLALKWASLPQNRIEIGTSTPSMQGVLGLAVALACYALAFIGYMFALRAFPVSVAYPLITSVTVVFISIAAAMFFGEPVTMMSVLGTVFILVGVAILMSSTK
jgi:multidrug transporter EmrE-like cation transporter